ncbi:hypothetical protein NDU88_001984 [Pleurodeles waltl]|uniref:Inhibitor of growth protein N-terminal histone-binding domain-containing protein n=1 Tax=Pleurodeles waltl TaxID=8319 RepID=A0AAV7T0X0_PLEWA|nr:hypothetical protein NDU88_001984 [Pleurodeles waltl]
MMRILIKHTEKKVAKLQDDIDKMEKEIENVPQKDLIKKNYEILDKIMEDYQIYLRDKKLRKVKRDDLDYKEGRVYNFARKYDNVRIPDIGKRTCEGTSDTDLTSGSSVSSLERMKSNGVSPSTSTSQGVSNLFCGNGKITSWNKADSKRAKTRRGGKRWKQEQSIRVSEFQEELGTLEAQDQTIDESDLVIVNLSD